MDGGKLAETDSPNPNEVVLTLDQDGFSVSGAVTAQGTEQGIASFSVMARFFQAVRFQPHLYGGDGCERPLPD